MPDDAGQRRAARPVLHDGCVLRLPGHDRRHAQPPGLSRHRAKRHAHRHAARRTAHRGRMTGLNATYDVAVIGAGPAGLAAATVAAEQGAATVLFDEQAEPGGQIYRGIASTPLRGPAVLGADYWHGAELLEPFRGSGAQYVPGAGVWSVTPVEGAPAAGYEVGSSIDGVAHLPRARIVILATGAQE